MKPDSNLSDGSAVSSGLEGQARRRHEFKRAPISLDRGSNWITFLPLIPYTIAGLADSPWWASSLCGAILLGAIWFTLRAVVRSRRQKITVEGGLLVPTNWRGRPLPPIPLNDVELVLNPGSWLKRPERFVVHGARRVSVEGVARPRELVKEIEAACGRQFPRVMVSGLGPDSASLLLESESDKPVEIYWSSESHDELSILCCFLVIWGSLLPFTMLKSPYPQAGLWLALIGVLSVPAILLWIHQVYRYTLLLVGGKSAAFINRLDRVEAVIAFDQTELRIHKRSSSGPDIHILKTGKKERILEAFEDHESLAALIEERSGKKFIEGRPCNVWTMK